MGIYECLWSSMGVWLPIGVDGFLDVYGYL